MNNNNCTFEFVSSENMDPWRKRHFPNPKPYKTSLLILTFLILIVFFITTKTLTPSPLSRTAFLPPQCGNSGDEKFMLYAPHSGFSNQVSEFRNAVLIAKILNRTLIVPPVLDHHAVALGSCPKFRVTDPDRLRFEVWRHEIELLFERRYISMADIIDISSLVSSSGVRFMDFRVFVSMWCGVNLDLVCSSNSNVRSSLLEKLKQCGSFLSGLNGSVSTCLYASQEDCKTTVWTYQTDDEDGVLDLFQADDNLKNKKKISFVRKRKDVYKALGPGSAAGQATVLAFGSLFTAPYKGSESHIDIQKASKDKRIQSLIEKIEFLPFVPEILNAGRKFALETIKAPYFCTQLRLLDGQFKNHWKDTFLQVKQKLDLLKQRESLPIHVFVMTDLPQRNWTGSYLGDLAKDSDAFKLIVLREEDELVSETAKKLVHAGHGMKLQSVSGKFDGRKQQCSALLLPDILLYMEETICSCASLGFLGTAGSTIAQSIESMRQKSICST